MKYSAKEKQWTILPLLVSLILLAATAAVLEYLFWLTKYLPLRLVSAICFYPALINAVLLIVGNGVSVGKKPELKIEPDSGWLRRFMADASFTVRRIFNSIRSFFDKRRTQIAVIVILIFTGVYQLQFFIMTRRVTSLTSVSYVAPVVLLALFLLFVTLEKWCKHTDTDDMRLIALLRNMRGTLVMGRLAILLVLISIVLKFLNIYDAQKLLVYVLTALWIYASIFIFLSLAVRFIKKELLTHPQINIPLPFAGGKDHDLGVLAYLEENTGITMRSLWSLRMVKTILPYTVVIAAVLFWVATGVVQVESYQEGAVYRFGKLESEVLSPGLHLTFPWPIDKVELYNTKSISKVTIGYRSSSDTDNTWTGNHGNNEYKLLLGGGDELVSINLRIEYRIADLVTYLSNSSSPEKLLEALAYELVTDRTINTDLESLLSVDRSAFAEDFLSELEADLDKYQVGIEVVSVVLESIHPPVEVAAVYQRIISAEIERDRYILDAEAKAAVAIAGANSKYDTSLSVANAAYFTKTAEAKAIVAQFMASVGADNAASDAYRYYKYLSAIGTAYGKARLVIIGEGIDSSNLYFGSILLNQ